MEKLFIYLTSVTWCHILASTPMHICLCSYSSSSLLCGCVLPCLPCVCVICSCIYTHKCIHRAHGTNKTNFNDTHIQILKNNFKKATWGTWISQLFTDTWQFPHLAFMSPCKSYVGVKLINSFCNLITSKGVMVNAWQFSEMDKGRGLIIAFVR